MFLQSSLVIQVIPPRFDGLGTGVYQFPRGVRLRVITRIPQSGLFGHSRVFSI